jgi:hypothetical protein
MLAQMVLLTQVKAVIAPHDNNSIVLIRAGLQSDENTTKHGVGIKYIAAYQSDRNSKKVSLIHYKVKLFLPFE